MSTLERPRDPLQYYPKATTENLNNLKLNIYDYLVNRTTRLR
uniref:Uncharacterized protein n=1 Tax=Megaviridae environmental sample TaxID=1737588 RepID=A0A5J6VKN1_9VIRU|nr:MAG: hypothetical protein [Megaviridae environmental sample]